MKQQTQERAPQAVVRITRKNLKDIFDGKLLAVIRRNIDRNNNPFSPEDKDEIAQKTIIRLYRSLRSKLRVLRAADKKRRKPHIEIPERKFYAFVKRFCVNEIIQWWRRSKREKAFVALHEDIDYDRSASEVAESLEMRGVLQRVFTSSETYCPRCHEKGCGGQCRKRRDGFATALFDPSAVNSDQDPMPKVDEDLAIHFIREKLRDHLDEDEIKVLVMISKDSTQKEIYKEVYKGEYRNASICHKKLKRIRRKILDNPELVRYFLGASAPGFNTLDKKGRTK